MAQGSLLRPLTFILLIDSLQLTCLFTHKFIDGITQSETLDERFTIMIPQFVDEPIECHVCELAQNEGDAH